MDSKVYGPPFRLPRLLLITQEFVVGSSEVVSGDPVADGPASGPVHVILNDKFLRISALFAAACNVAL